MNKEENRKFIGKTESLVKPEDVTAISFLGDFNKWLPKKQQQKLMEKGSQKIPYMGFIVDPYCLFLTYRVKDVEAAQAMLPEGYELVDISTFKGGEKYPMIIFCAFSARTSAFIGIRLEMYLIARNIETGLISWVISGYETNTNSHDPKNGFCGYTSEPTIFTTTPYGELLVDVKNRDDNREFAVTVDINEGSERELDEALWIQGNLMVDYGGDLKDPSSKAFGLIFDPQLMKKALCISTDKIQIDANSYMDSLIDWEKPEEIVLFPYSQHFIIRQDLKREELLSREDLETQALTFLQRRGFKTMKGDDIKKPLFRGMILSSIMNLVIILFLLLRLRS